MLSTSDGNRGLLGCFRIFIDDDDDDDYLVESWRLATKQSCKTVLSNTTRQDTIDAWRKAPNISSKHKLYRFLQQKQNKRKAKVIY